METVTDEELGKFEQSVILVLLSIMLLFLAKTCIGFARGAGAPEEEDEQPDDDMDEAEDVSDFEEDLHSD